MNHRFARACAVWMTLAGAVAAATIELDLEDEDGAAVRDVRCGVVDPRTGVTRFTFRGPRYDGPGRPRAGDRLYVYRRGLDLLTKTLKAGDNRLSATMARTSERFRLVLAPDAAGEDAPVVEIVSLPTEVRRRSRPVLDARTVRLGRKAIEVPLPRGMDTSFFVRARGRLPWPVTHRPRPGETCTIRVEPERAVRVRYHDHVATGARRVLCLPDYQWQPRVEAGVEARRVDAWRWYLNGPGWLAPQFEAQAGVVRVCPDVPLHLFARIDGVPRYRKVARGAPRIDLAEDRRRPVPRRPTIDGAPVRKGTIIAPGLLDRRSIARLLDFDRGGDFAFRAGPRSKAWPAPRLPASRWLTLWEPGHGLAHVSWRDGERPLDATRATGTIEVRPAPGVDVVGHAAVYATWKGGRSVRTVPPLGRLRRPFVGGPLVFRGLLPGYYAVSLEVRVTDRTGRVLATRTYTECATGAIIELPLVRR